MCLVVTSQMLLLQHCDVIENNNIGNNAAIPSVEKLKLLMNVIEWIAHVQEKQFTTTPLNQGRFLSPILKSKSCRSHITLPGPVRAVPGLF